MFGNLLKNFNKNTKLIRSYYHKLVKITKRQKYVGNANEWIIDNYYLINEQERNIPLEITYSKLKNKRKEKLYKIISEYLSQNNYQINTEKLFNYLNDYQEKNNDLFSYNDINFIPLAIKLVLIEKIAEMAVNLNVYLDEKLEVENYFSKIKKGYEVNIEKILKKIEDKDLEDYAYYLEQVNYQLKVLGQSSEIPLLKLNELLEKRNFTIKEIITISHDRQATNNVLMVNLFSSFKMIINYEIENFYKNISYVEKLLMSEKVDVFNNLYDNVKYDYREKIIKGSKKRGMSEYDFAKEVVDSADGKGIHVGEILFKEPNYSLRINFYIISVFILTLVLSYHISTILSLALFITLLIPISNVVIEFYNYILTRFFKPRTIFKLKFKDGIPKEYATMVVIPTIVSDKNKVNKMFENLEVYYLSNRSDNLYFALLGDAKGERVKDASYDIEVVEAGLEKVKELNKKYGKEIFYFAYRNRFYSESEDEYLGFERKRGALEHFNKLLLNKLNDEEKEKYFRTHTFKNFDKKIKYVITLDSDTQLVLNTAFYLIGAMAHPMNRPVLSKNKNKVIKGYGIMQPRISVDVKVTNKSLYSQLFAGLGGLDVYIRKSSDVYQDVFGEGSFVGKGIYDLEIFDTVLSNNFPDNLILSHDLLEGNYLRCGFINDVELFDDFPSSYLNDTMRHHRWNRGDWQIISWLKKKVKNKVGRKINNPINNLGKWKIFDNLRRSLISVCLLVILLYGLVFDSVNSYRYLLVVSMLVGIPIIFYIFTNIIPKSKHDIWIKYYMNLIFGFLATVNRSYIKFASIPYEAYLYLDSIVRSLYRMFISKKKLLNWITAEEAEKIVSNDLISYIRKFVPNYFVSILLIGCCIYFELHSGIIYILSIIWITAPILMYYLSKEIKGRVYDLSEQQKNQVKDIGLRTWSYFEDYLTEDTNYLIPDNYQENRDNVIDYRTSSTNIGFSLVSVISAHSMKLINTRKAVDYIEKIISSVEKLEKWNGHLYNWYNIYTMKVIMPYFVSTVDSGNFIAALYVVKGFLNEIGEEKLIKRIDKLIEGADFTKLYNYDLEVFSIGYNVSDEELLSYCYNNFSSESRLTSYIAIAKGDISHNHWFRLDKSMTKYKSYKGVASWSGSAFEYFMPLIFMKTYPHTLLDESYYLAYFAHKNFMREIDRNLPWGISESAYSELDNSDNYKYQSFGIPYLKLQEIKKVPIVISPYSSLMALTIAPHSVYENIDKFKRLGMHGKYGFYESYDHEAGVVVKNYYAHHQGMILSSIANYLSENVIQRYFHSNQNIKSFEMLLKEKVQLRSYIDLKISKYKKYDYLKESFENDVREYKDLKELPELGVLSNGYYTVLLNDRGGGFSKYNEIQINRYRRMPQESYGMFVYIKNLNTNKVWSNTYYPLKIMSDKYRVVFAMDRIKYTREDDGIVSNTEITVTKDHNAEIRRLTLKNNNNYDVTLELTSYSEVVLCKNAEDIAHRSFGGLMVNSEFLEDYNALLFSRKTRDGSTYYVVHQMHINGDNKIDDFETSRASFIGRNNSVYNPDAIYKKEKLDKKLGSVIDPVMSIRKNITIKSGEEITINYLIGFGKSRSQIRDIISSYSDDLRIKRAFDLSTIFNNMRTSYYNLDTRKMSIFNRMLKYIYQSFPLNQDREKYLTYNTLSQPALWRFGVSGDLPIILVEIRELKNVGFIRELLEAYDYYKSRGLYIDIVIINFGDNENYTYIQNYINSLMHQIHVTNLYLDSPGAVYQVDAKDFKENEYNLFRTVASIYLNAHTEKSLEEQVQDLDDTNKNNRHTPYDYTDSKDVNIPDAINYYNNYGGFISEGKEYLITNVNTPMPWVNIMSNGSFGTVITNDLGGFTYTINSREFKLTRWSNDAVGDPSSEIFIINNRRFKPSSVIHGFGYSVFTLNTDEYDIYMKVFVGKDVNIKFYDLKVNNKLYDEKEFKIDFVLKMVLGVSEEMTHRYLSSKFEDDLNALFVFNSYNDYFKDKNVFITSTETIVDYQVYDAITHSVSSKIKVKGNSNYEISFMIGEDKLDVISRYQIRKNISIEFDKIRSFWNEKLEVIQVSTPDKAFDYMINGWYLYQALVSRLYARTGFYQVGGAYGYRDQLQDVMALLYSDPSFARNQILKHANHQFKEGDVLHWWHEELKFGSRTRFTDDYLWLVYVTYEYIKVTGDYSILEEPIGFVVGDNLRENEHEKGINYEYTSDTASLYEHLKLCMNKALNQMGIHGLPLMGSGDWNDGMNMVGVHGKGESIFVGFFLYDLLDKMIEITSRYSDESLIDKYYTEKENLKNALHKYAWDGKWYLRAYFDDGTPLGSNKNEEAKIDVVAQSWSILSDVATEEQKKTIFEEVEKHLVDKNTKIIKLLTPGFKNSKPNPGYIMDYTVGVRENGAQYTHGALWYIMSLLREGYLKRGYEYFQMINPANRTATEEDVLKYQVEPYVIVADVYSNLENAGRGGWSWYTGSAGWAYKIGVEEILGLKKEADTLTIKPAINPDWERCEVIYRYGSSTYKIEILNPGRLDKFKTIVEIDGEKSLDGIIKLKDDGKVHNIKVTLVEDI